MKKILKMILFSLAAIFLTSLWNKGFIIEADLIVYLKASVIIAVIYYLLLPISKLILFPLNFLSMGLLSLIVYCFLFYFFTKFFAIIEIQSWVFVGGKIIGIELGRMEFSQAINVFLSSASVSTIINLLEKIT